MIASEGLTILNPSSISRAEQNWITHKKLPETDSFMQFGSDRVWMFGLRWVKCGFTWVWAVGFGWHSLYPWRPEPDRLHNIYFFSIKSLKNDVVLHKMLRQNLGLLLSWSQILQTSKTRPLSSSVHSSARVSRLGLLLSRFLLFLPPSLLKSSSLPQLLSFFC